MREGGRGRGQMMGSGGDGGGEGGGEPCVAGAAAGMRAGEASPSGTQRTRQGGLEAAGCPSMARRKRQYGKFQVKKFVISRLILL